LPDPDPEEPEEPEPVDPVDPVPVDPVPGGSGGSCGVKPDVPASAPATGPVMFERIVGGSTALKGEYPWQVIITIFQ